MATHLLAVAAVVAALKAIQTLRALYLTVEQAVAALVAAPVVHHTLQMVV